MIKKNKNTILIFVVMSLFLTVGCNNSVILSTNEKDNTEITNQNEKEKKEEDNEDSCCEDHENVMGGNVLYTSCPCKKEPLGMIKGVSVLRLYPKIEDAVRGDTVYSFYPASILIPEEDVPFSSNELFVAGWILNIPDFAKQWESGITVYYEGILYPLCCNFIACRTVCYNVALTKLKVKEL